MNFAHFVCAIIRFAGHPSLYTVVFNTNRFEGNQTMVKILKSLLIVAAMSCSVVLAQDNLRVTREDGQQRVEFALHGTTSCVMVNDKIFCAAGTTRAPIKLASTASR